MNLQQIIVDNQNAKWANQIYLQSETIATALNNTETLIKAYQDQQTVINNFIIETGKLKERIKELEKQSSEV